MVVILEVVAVISVGFVGSCVEFVRVVGLGEGTAGSGCVFGGAFGTLFWAVGSVGSS